MSDTRGQGEYPAALTAGFRERLRHFPVPLFALVMGLAGFAMACQRAEAVLDLPFSVAPAFSWLAVGAFLLIAALYLLKLAIHPAEVAKEFRHPVRVNFFPTMSIAMVLLSALLCEPAPALAKWLWTVGAAVHFVFTLYVMNAWIHRSGIELGHVSPAWFIPVVGNVLLPVSGVRFYPLDVSWFFFSVGFVFWLVVLTIVMHRLFFHAALPERMTPTLFILVAPPAVSFLAYVALVGHVDAFARVLYYTSLFLTMLLASNMARFLRARFYLSAWAYSFPLAAVTIATLVMVDRVGGDALRLIATTLLWALMLVVAALLWRTGVAVSRGEICVEDA
jgi:tellurite resistance protein